MLGWPRSYWISAAAAAYTAFAALRAANGRGPAWIALFGLPALLAIGWRLTAPPSRGEDRTEPMVRAAARACLAGAAVVCAARTGPSAPALVAMGNLGAAIASMAALVAIARLGGAGGVLEPPPSARRLDAVAFSSLFWTVAVTLPAVWAAAPERAAGLDPIAIDYATAAASLGAMLVAIVALARARIARRLELGVADRLEAALLLTGASLSVGLAAAFVGVARPEGLLPIACTIAALATAASAVTREATAVSRALRLALTLGALAVPVALLAVYAVYAAPHLGLGGRPGAFTASSGAAPVPAGAVVFAACAACALAGLAAPRLARRLAPEGARWIDALDAAARAAMNPDPDAALEAALAALRDAAERGGGYDLGALAIYRLAPPERVSIDRAGYVHTERAEVPERLVALAAGEPEQILRVDAAEAVEVRRPEVRALVAWLSERRIGAAALIADAAGPLGLLVIPRGRRAAPMTLEEARRLRALADRLGAVIGVSSMLARSRARELEARAEAGAVAEEATRLRRALDHGAGRLRAVASALARPARAAVYGPAARAAVEQLERAAASGGPITLLTAPGIDAAAWAALAHLASPRAGGPVAIVDGASPSEHALARWRDPAESPLEAAKGGTLVVLDAQALPAETQRFLGAALPEDVGLVVAMPHTADTLVATGALAERLADRLGDRAVALPALAERGEDLRALALEQLARIGARLRGRPFGLDIAALQALLEHTWPGNDAELAAVLLRAALAAEGDVIRLRELEAAGFPPPGAAPPDLGRRAELVTRVREGRGARAKSAKGAKERR